MATTPTISVNEILPPSPPPAAAEEAAAEEEVAMAASSIWKQIDLSESYMVCCMFEEAASLAASVVQQIRNTTSSKAVSAEMSQVLESAGMVFVQSLKEMGRTGELFVELEKLFGSVVEVPVQVFLTGACMQISEGHLSNLRAIFEEFLKKWPTTESQNFSDGCQMHFGMDVGEHLEVAEVYAITLLGVVLRKPDAAISWTEQAAIPEEKRQEMLRKLRSLHISAQSSTSLGSATVQTSDKVGNSFSSGSGSAMGQKLLKIIPKTSPNGEEQKVTTSKSIHSSIKHTSDWSVSWKFGKFQLVFPRRKTMILVSLLLFTFYILRSRSRILKQFITRQVSSIRKALIDAWQLAFSVQVNPLAAVQQVPLPASRGSR
ncbi:protein APEM9 [Iris pallida]|uniref:Protein APEM9 n=1 Tax=Iris pallida TaxID=29817 RepID=A0AAX6FD30_IRIPA|nr:protein APEM9 [Iris pallida]